jgi:hypothetical protein
MAFKDLADIIADFSQAILVILGGLVFVQIKIAKDDLQTRCKRESTAASVELGKNFGRELIPLIEAYYEKAKAQGHTFKPAHVKDFCFEEIEHLTQEEKQIYQESLDFIRTHPDYHKDCIEILNWLEVFAMSFTKGVADESAIFTAAAQVYCTFIEKSFAILCFMRHKDQVKLFENTVELYNLWSDKIKKSGLELLQHGVLEKLQEVNKTKSMIPIGVRKEK